MYLCFNVHESATVIPRNKKKIILLGLVYSWVFLATVTILYGSYSRRHDGSEVERQRDGGWQGNKYETGIVRHVVISYFLFSLYRVKQEEE